MSMYGPYTQPAPLSATQSNWHWLLLAALAYYLSARLGMTIFSLQPANITLLWLPAGIGLAMCVVGGPVALAMIFMASFSANLPGMAHASSLMQVLHTSVAAGADTLAPWLAARMLKFHLPYGLTYLGDLFPFILRVCALPTLVSALILATNLVIGRYIDIEAGPAFVAMLLFADSLGILISYPLIHAWQRRTPMAFRDWRAWACVTGLAVLLAWLAFEHVAGLIFLVMPVMLYLVFRVPDHATLLALAVTLCLIVALAGHNLGPFNVGNVAHSRFMLQAFLLSTALITLGLMLQHDDLMRTLLAKQDWQYRANHDALTGLPNRRTLIPEVEHEIERAHRSGRGFALALIDIDHFKQINDKHGHPRGDAVLVALARHLQASLRNIDIAARIGGEEFAILFPETARDDALRALERIREALAAQDIEAGGQILRITISAGLAHWDEQTAGGNAETLLEQADQRLYAAKRAGRNCVVAA
ncbi:diguanylate cyclase [Chitinimonas sp. BJYL2]|uniref:GGDEF domain-containing protein n=1 Tax=Chitinimonas sp. BJYL2 TaxID=2976696 RepID=UPI0022B4AE4C|nr:diguanylate cyclase [Chitinimonas sp. BJYL2]